MGAFTEFDHFDQGSLPSPWTGITSGEGAVSMSDSGILLTIGAGATADAACVVRQIDRTLANYHRFEVRMKSLTTTPSFRTSVRLIANTGTPTVDTRANINAKTLLWQYQFASAGVYSGTLGYRDGSNVQKDWQEASQTFATAGSAGSTPTIVNPDYFIKGFELDEVNQRMRQWWKHCASGTSFATDSGEKLIALTDWVSYSSIQFGTNTNLWLLLGFLENPASLATTEGNHIDWFCWEGADSYDEFWDNQQAQGASGYDIAHVRRLTGTDGRIWLPESRTGVAIAKGSPAWKSNSVQFGSALLTSGTYWQSFSGNSGGVNSLGLASSSTAQDGSWTEYASNPVLAPSAGTDRGNFGQNILLEDQTDVASRRWKWIVTAQSDIDSKLRVFLYYASAITGPYTLDGTLLDYDAGADGNMGCQLYCNPVLYNGTWYLFYVGIDNAAQWKNYVATGATLRAGSFTKDRSIDYLPNGIEMTVTTGSSTSQSQTVNSTTGLVKDALVLYDNDTTNTTWVLGRVRKVTDSTHFEFYGNQPGVASSGAFRTVDKGKKYIHWIEKVGSEWRFWGTAFGVFYLHASYNANYEGGALWTSTSLTGAQKAIDWQRTPGTYLARNGNSKSAENLRGVQLPYTASGAATRPSRVAVSLAIRI